MSIINQLNFVEYNGMQICTIGKRFYKLMSNPKELNNVILFPILSVQDELLKQQARTRLERQALRRKTPNEINSSYEPLWATVERQTLQSPQSTTTT